MAEFLQSTPDVLAVLEQANGHFDQAQQHSQSALDTGMNMTAGPWLGASSQKYMQLWQQIHDEFQTHINQGRQDVETTKSSVNTQANQDQDL
jgi:uncharacterized protein YukE